MNEQTPAVDALTEVLSAKRFKIGEKEYAFVDVEDARKAIKNGFVPSPREYDIYSSSALVPEQPFGDTRVQPTAYMERKPEYEQPRITAKLDKRYGKGNWKLVELQQADDPDKQILKLMLKNQ